MSSEILSVLEYMEKEKGIPRADMIATIANALKTAAQKGVNSGQELRIEINPNSKIPAMRDMSASPSIRLFESGSMLFYLAEKFGEFLPTDPHKRAETMNWLMWQMGSAPYVGGGLGHFYAYAPFKMQYPIDRFAMETKRQLHVLDTHLAQNQFMVGDDYTIADIAIWPWYGAIMREAYNAQEFLSVHEYTHLDRWVS